MTFTVDIDQNRWLASGATRVDAILTVSSDGAPVPGAATDGLEIIIIDCSGSMGGGKIRAAKQATAAAIAELRDGVRFAVVQGTHIATQLYPPQPMSTAVADERTRREATDHVGRLRTGGGTGIGAWLSFAARIATAHPAAIRHAILLTDGQNGESDAYFADRLGEATGMFTCDCRGVGVDWRVDELRTVASTLLGSVDIVADPADLATDFRAVMGASMGKALAGVSLRLWSPRGAQVRFLKQVSPTVEDLTARRGVVGPLLGDYPLGSWGAETREYHLCLDVVPGGVGDEMLAARANLVRSGSDEVLGQGLVAVEWTEDAALSTGIARGVAHYTGQAELSAAIQEGLAARRSGDERTATARLGRAVALATGSGNDDTARLLSRVVEVVDAPTGTIKLRRQVSDADEMTLDTRSSKTVRVRGHDQQERHDQGDDRRRAQP